MMQTKLLNPTVTLLKATLFTALNYVNNIHEEQEHKSRRPGEGLGGGGAVSLPPQSINCS